MLALSAGVVDPRHRSARRAPVAGVVSRFDAFFIHLKRIPRAALLADEPDAAREIRAVERSQHGEHRREVPARPRVPPQARAPDAPRGRQARQLCGVGHRREDVAPVVVPCERRLGAGERLPSCDGSVAVGRGCTAR